MKQRRRVLLASREYNGFFQDWNGNWTDDEGNPISVRGWSCSDRSCGAEDCPTCFSGEDCGDDEEDEDDDSCAE